MSLGNNTFGSKLTYDGLSGQYKYYYKTHYFPKLLQDGAVPENDKAFIRNMLTKPWNLYIFRHSALTEKSQILKEHVLRDHAGWTMTSKMPQVYIHYFGTESSRSLFEARGIIKEKDHRVFQLRPKNNVLTAMNQINQIANSVSIAGWFYLMMLTRKQSKNRRPKMIG